MNCPKCRGEMGSKLVLFDKGGWWKGVSRDSLQLDFCGACGGAWFDKGEWTMYLERRLEAGPKPPKMTEANRKIYDARVATCPRCSVSLEHKKRGNATVDVCSACGGMWLDGGEYPTAAPETWEARLAKLVKD